ncbi:hypothetical protein D3C75_1030170 [compost metagenome]
MHRDLNRFTGEGIGENGNKGAAFVAMQHGVDNVAAISTQHAAIITHRFTGGTLNQAVNHTRCALAKPGILAVLAHGTDHVIPFIGFGDQARDLFRRVLQIRIKGDNQIPGDMAKTGHNGVVLAVISVEQNRDDMAAGCFGSIA